MLSVTLKPGEKVTIGEAEVVILKVDYRRVTLGIRAPMHIKIGVHNKTMTAEMKKFINGFN